MNQRFVRLGLLAASIAAPGAAWSHGSTERMAEDGMAGPPAPAVAPAAAGVIPVNLLAAVCGMHGHHDSASFQRRVELARVLLARADPAAEPPEVPLFEDLGGYSYPVTTGSAKAQRYFDQGLRLTYAFNHPEALRAFRAAQRADPACALCFWGEAYALGPNINAPMDGEAIAPAMATTDRAMALRAGASEREQALIEALSRRSRAAIRPIRPPTGRCSTGPTPRPWPASPKASRATRTFSPSTPTR